MYPNSQFVLTPQESGPLIVPEVNETIYLSNPALVIPVRINNLKKKIEKQAVSRRKQLNMARI